MKKISFLIRPGCNIIVGFLCFRYITVASPVEFFFKMNFLLFKSSSLFRSSRKQNSFVFIKSSYAVGFVRAAAWQMQLVGANCGVDLNLS